MKRILPTALAALLLAAPFTTPAHAQQSPKTQRDADAEAEAQEAAKRAEQAKEERAKAPPPAIPGAEGAGVVAPADKLASDMAPNDALFDAINRGDAAAARDALNRGAQLDAKNVLGQTPIDASIDSNRTDITFLLLSMRGASPSAVRSARGSHAAPVLTSLHGKPGTKQTAHKLPTTQTAAARPPGQNPGVPNPTVGFIGF